jgi:hypothetical protein
MVVRAATRGTGVALRVAMTMYWIFVVLTAAVGFAWVKVRRHRKTSSRGASI